MSTIVGRKREGWKIISIDCLKKKNIYAKVLLCYWVSLFFFKVMAETSNLDSNIDNMMIGNPFPYDFFMKLDENNCELWSRAFKMSVMGHQKKYILEEDEPNWKAKKYDSWEEVNNMMMSWLLNNMQPQIATVTTFFSIAKGMWEFLWKTCSHCRNINKILSIRRWAISIMARWHETCSIFCHFNFHI